MLYFKIYYFKQLMLKFYITIPFDTFDNGNISIKDIALYKNTNCKHVFYYSCSLYHTFGLFLSETLGVFIVKYLEN